MNQKQHDGFSRTGEKVKLLFVCIFLFGGSYRSAAQVGRGDLIKDPAAYTYYLDITGADTKEKCMQLIDLMRSKTAVTFFETKDFPSLYFILKSAAPVSENDVIGWLKNSMFKPTYFAEGDIGLKQLQKHKAKKKPPITGIQRF